MDLSVFNTIFVYNERESLCTGDIGVLKSLVRRWSLNRPEDGDRVREIRECIERDGRVDGLISVALLEDEGMVCWDGLHRFRALCGIDNPPVCLFHVWKNPSETELKERFISLNKSVPVPTLYTEKERDNELIKTAEHLIEMLMIKYKQVFSSSNRPNDPNVNRDSLLSDIHAFLKENPGLTSKQMWMALMKANMYIKKCDLSDVKQRALDKCKQIDCYLFLKSINLWLLMTDIIKEKI